MLYHPFSQKPFQSNISHGTGLLVENFPKHAQMIRGGNINNSGLILGSSSNKRQGDGRETSAPFKNVNQPLNYKKLEPIFSKKGKGLKRNNIKLVI